MMKTTTLAAAFACGVTNAHAGALTDPIVESDAVAEATASSSSGAGPAIILLTFVVLTAAAASRATPIPLN